MNSNAIIKILVLIAGLILAVVMGNLLVTDTFTAFAWIAGVSVLVISIYLERKIWLLVPFLGTLDLSLRIPGQPSTIMVAQMWFLAFALILFLMRKLPWRIRFAEIEFWFLGLTLFVLQVYVRNPVGVNIFGGGSVGGKPYFLYLLNLATAVILAGYVVQPKELKYAFRLSIVAGLLNLVVSIVGLIVPSVGFWTGTSDTRSGETNYEDVGKTYDAGAASRIGFLVNFARNASLWLSSCISPLRACVHPLWGLLLIITVVGAALSGFRTTVAVVALTYLVGIAYRGGLPSLIISAFGSVLMVIFLSIGNMIVPYPPNIQRALSFLPGTWEQRYVEDAEGSSEWRFEIWREVLKSDRYIQDKWFGDGLGFSAADLQKSIALRESHARGVAGFDAHRESILLSGDYHSGPLQTIRVIGYTGLLFLICAQIRIAMLAHRQIMRCRNTEWYRIALFFGIPLIWNPIVFLFIFGDFKTATATLLLGGAMIRMLENNLPLPAYVKRDRFAALLPNQNLSMASASGRGRAIS